MTKYREIIRLTSLGCSQRSIVNAIMKVTTIEEIKQDIFEYVEIFYNRKRMHSYLGYMSPVEYRLAHCA